MSGFRRSILHGGSVDPYAGYTRLSSLLVGAAQFDPITIGSGAKVIADLQMTDGQAIGQLTISSGGELRIDPRVNTRLVAQGIDNSGLLWTDGALDSSYHPKDWEIALCGPAPTVNGYTAPERVTVEADRASIGLPVLGTGIARGLTHLGNTKTGNDGNKNDSGGVSRGFINRAGGTVKLFGTGPTVRRLNGHYLTPSTTLTLDAPVTAKAGARVLVSPTWNFDPSYRTEIGVLAADVTDSMFLTLTAPLARNRWGRMQYATNLGPSLTPDPFTDGSSNSYVGSISGTTMTITSATGTISLGERVSATGMNTKLTYVTSFGSGTGGVGTYNLSQSQTVPAGTAISCTGMRAHPLQNAEIDERAFVCIMSSTGRILAKDIGNTSLASLGFGFHGMSMGLTSVTQIQGVQMIDYGQKGLLGRYAWHFHIPSYNADGSIKTDGIAGTTPFSQTASPAGPNYPANAAAVKNCAFDTGHNRAFVFHACRGVVATGNIAYKSLGHSFFEEDSSEEDNTSQDNVAFYAQIPVDSTVALKQHELERPAGHWMANQRNIHKDNWGVDMEGVGFWNAPTGNGSGCLGFSANVPLYPNNIPIRIWDGVTAFCCAQGGETGTQPVDEQGTGGNTAYNPTDTETPSGNHVFSEFQNIRIFKCGRGVGVQNQNPNAYNTVTRNAYHNRLEQAHYTFARVADNMGPCFAGVAQEGSINEFGIGLGWTLNQEAAPLRQFAASYHGLLKFRNMSMFNFTGTSATDTPVDGVNGNGVINTNDLYTDSLHGWSVPMPGWRLYNSNGTWLTPGPALMNDVTTYDSYLGSHFDADARHFKHHLGNLYDHWGSLSQSPTDRGEPQSHVIYNQPILTTGAVTRLLAGNVESCVTSTPMMGMMVYDLDATLLYGVTAPNTSWGQAVRRKWQLLDASRNPIAGAAWEGRDSYSKNDFTAPTDGGWAAHPELWADTFWGNKHALWPRSSIIRMTHPGYAPCTRISGRFFHVTDGLNASANNTTDFCYLGLPITGANTITAVTHVPGSFSNYASTASWALLQASTPGHYWHDTANNELWLKVAARHQDYYYGDFAVTSA